MPENFKGSVFEKNRTGDYWLAWDHVFSLVKPMNPGIKYNSTNLEPLSSIVVSGIKYL